MIAPLGVERVAAIFLAIGGRAILLRRMTIRARWHQTLDRLAVRRHLAEQREAIAKRLKDRPRVGGMNSMRPTIAALGLVLSTAAPAAAEQIAHLQEDASYF